MAKKTDKAVKDIAKEIKKLRKENEKLTKTLEKTRKDQAGAHQEILTLIEERLTAGDTGTAEAEDRASDGKGEKEQRAAETKDDSSPDAGSEDGPEVTEAAGRRAKELGVEPTSVEGTGSGGRILVKDVEAAAGQ